MDWKSVTTERIDTFKFHEQHIGAHVCVWSDYCYRRKFDDKSEEQSCSVVNSGASAVSPAADHVSGNVERRNRSSA